MYTSNDCTSFFWESLSMARISDDIFINRRPLPSSGNRGYTEIKHNIEWKMGGKEDGWEGRWAGRRVVKGGWEDWKSADVQATFVVA